MNEELIKSTRNTAPAICFISLICLWFFIYHTPDSIVFILPGLMIFSLVFFIYYLASEGHLSDMIGGMFISIVLMAIAAAIPIIGWLALVVWFIYNIKRSIEGIINLLPEALISVLLYACLLIPAILRMDNYKQGNNSVALCIGALYLFISAILCMRINNRSREAKHSFYLLSVNLLSVPIIFILLASIAASLRAAFKITVVNSSIRVPQNVSGYVTQRGTIVDSYTRVVTTTVETAVITPGAGAAGISMAGSLGASTTKKELKEKTLNLPDDDEFKTNRDHKFYRIDDIDVSKLDSLIKRLLDKKVNPQLKHSDVNFYFDNTVMGKGDRGVALTNSGIYCSPELFDEEGAFYLPYDSVKGVKIKGTVNMTILLSLEDGSQKKIRLTQSNSGAKKIHKLIEYIIQNR